MTTFTLNFLIGASGSGKTAAAARLEERNPRLKILYFDSIGVPSTEVMIQQFGSGEAWQRSKTLEWTDTIADKSLTKQDVVLDGQTRPSLIEQACAARKIVRYRIILLDCTDEIRAARLSARGQVALASAQMMNWARWLREEVRERNGTVLDNTHLDLERTVQLLEGMLVEPLIKDRFERLS